MSRLLPLPLTRWVLSVMNHVLKQQSSARDRMRSHAGRQLRIVVDGPLGSSLHSDARIDGDGLLVGTVGGVPDVVITLAPGIDALYVLLRGGLSGMGTRVRIEGEVMLASAVREVAQRLRWDYEEDLSRVVGDAAAHRIGRAARGVREGADGLRQRSREALQRSAGGPGGPLVSRRDLDDVALEIARLSRDISRLENSLKDSLKDGQLGSLHAVATIRR